MSYRARGWVWIAACSAIWIGVNVTSGCHSDGGTEGASAQPFCGPGKNMIGKGGVELDEPCDCTFVGSDACLISTGWTCGKDGRWAQVTEGACSLANNPCAEPMASLEACFGSYRTCVVKRNGQVCGFR